MVLGETVPPKILIAINTAWNIANFRVGLIRSLQQAGYQVLAVAPPDEHVPRILSLGVQFIPAAIDNKGTNAVRDFGLFLSYLALLRRERPALLLSYTVKPNIYGGIAARFAGVPVISNVAGLGTPFIRDSWITRVVERLYRAALAGARKVFFQNNEDMALFLDRRLVRPEIVERLPGSGVDVTHFAPPVQQGRARRPGPLRFLLSTRLLRDKGVVEFVDAIRLLRTQGIEAEFQLLGFLYPGNPSAITRDEISKWEQEGLIRYLGSIEDVRPVVSDADCVVLPSYREGAPRSLLEAASLCKPLIATDTAGCRDVVENGVTGYLCLPRDAGDLALKMNAMLRLPEHARAEMGRKGREKMIREFDERIVIEKYLRAVNAILKQPS